MRASRRTAVVIAVTSSGNRRQELHRLATISGVGFFDVGHGGAGQTGHAAPYNRELHPLVAFSATNC